MSKEPVTLPVHVQIVEGSKFRFTAKVVDWNSIGLERYPDGVGRWAVKPKRIGDSSVEQTYSFVPDKLIKQMPEKTAKGLIKLEFWHSRYRATNELSGVFLVNTKTVETKALLKWFTRSKVKLPRLVILFEGLAFTDVPGVSKHRPAQVQEGSLW